MDDHVLDKIEAEVEEIEKLYTRFYDCWRQNLGGTHCVEGMLDAAMRIRTAIKEWEKV